MSNTEAKFVVGQKVWLVFRDSRHKPQWAEITKVGRKWIYLDNRDRRFDKYSLWIDGGDYSSPAKVYRCKEEHDQELRESHLTREIVKCFDWHSRSEYSLEQLEQVAKILGL